MKNNTTQLALVFIGLAMIGTGCGKNTADVTIATESYNGTGTLARMLSPIASVGTTITDLKFCVSRIQLKDENGNAKQFEDDDYARREAASKRLAELGGIALPQVRAAIESDSAEVRIRCRRLIAQAQSGATARKLTGHNAELECLAFSPDGRFLASGDWQGTIKIWNTADWKNTATLRYPTE